MNIKDYLDGWLIGDFTPCLINSKDVEVGLRSFFPYEYEGFYKREKTKEFIIIINGEVLIDDIVYSKGDIVEIDPGVVYDIMPISKVDALIIKDRSGADRVYNDLISLDRIEKVFDCFWYGNTKEHINRTKVINNCIRNEDITIVVQGAIDKAFTYSCLQSIKKYIPGSTIILSTWKGSDVSGLEYDELILSDDPGAVRVPTVDGDDFKYNINRQLVSTLNGIKAAHTEYVMKLRSDMVVLGNDFLEFFDRFPKRNEKYTLFENRLIVSEIFSLEWEYHQNSKGKFKFYRPYHVSDMFVFGRRNDMLKFFESIPFYPDNLIISDKNRDVQYKYLWVFPPEQYYFINAFSKRFPDIHMLNLFDYDEKTIECSRDYVMNNYIILNTIQLKMFSGKHARDWLGNNGITYYKDGILKHTDFLEYYKHI